MLPLTWTEYRHDKLGPTERLFAARVPDGHLRAIVYAPPKLALPGTPRVGWILTVDHLPFTALTLPNGASRIGEGLGRDLLADAAEQASRRCPTIDEMTDAKMQLVAPSALLGITVQRSDRPPYMVQAMQIGEAFTVPPGNAETARKLALT